MTTTVETVVAGNPAAAQAAIDWTAKRYPDIVAVCRARGVNPRELSGPVLDAATLAAHRGVLRTLTPARAVTRALDAMRIDIHGGGVTRERRGPHPRAIPCADDGGGCGDMDPLARLIVAERIDQMVAESHWCAGAVAEALGAPRGSRPNLDPRGERTRRRMRARERGGQFGFQGYGWSA